MLKSRVVGVAEPCRSLLSYGCFAGRISQQRLFGARVALYIICSVLFGAEVVEINQVVRVVAFDWLTLEQIRPTCSGSRVPAGNMASFRQGMIAALGRCSTRSICGSHDYAQAFLFRTDDL